MTSRRVGSGRAESSRAAPEEHGVRPRHYDRPTVTRPESTDLQVLTELADPAGRDVVDIGCGQGGLVRELAALGSRVVGIEISEQQLETARERDGDSGAEYRVGTAQALPLADGSVDVAVFMRTLHHVPGEQLGAALREARRVLRPDGIVYVAEPLAEGDYFTLTSLVEDELEVRRAAQAALADAGRYGLARSHSYEYDVRLRIGGVDAYRGRVVSVDPHRAATFEACRHEIAAAFTRLGEPGGAGGERQFVQPMRADVLTVAAGDPTGPGSV